MQAFAIVMAWSLITIQASLRICQDITDVPGAELEEAFMSRLVSSLAIKGLNWQVGVCCGSLH